MPPAAPSVAAAAAPEPLLRWAGGKRRMLGLLTAMLPASYGRYHEPFFGGGALFWTLPAPAGSRLADLNPDLVALYLAVRDDTDELVAELRQLADDLAVHADPKQHYLDVREAFNGGRHRGTSVRQSARMLYLNRTCFNGLWRENRSGAFNVPWGRLANPTVCDEPRIRACARQLDAVTLAAGSYLQALGVDVDRAGDDQLTAAGFVPAPRHVRAVDPKLVPAAGDLVYLDPPYVPVSATASFAAYTAGGFGPADQADLAAVVGWLAARDVHVIASNSTAPLVAQLYGPGGAGLQLVTSNVSRSISAVGATRGNAGETLATNVTPELMRDAAAARSHVERAAGSWPAVWAGPPAS